LVVLVEECVHGLGTLGDHRLELVPVEPRWRPVKVFADRAYDHDKYRALVQAKEIRPVIARRGVPHGSGLGEYRYVVGQAIRLLHWFRRLRIRWEIRDDIHEAFMAIGCAITCWRRLKIHALC
jgi:hypothetical protein